MRERVIIRGPSIGQSRARAADDTYHSILKMILSRELSGGTMLQERLLCEEFSVSRTPMRETLRRLEGEGLVVRANDGSLMIRLVTLEEFLNSLEVRLLVEPHAASVAAKSMPDDVLKRLRKGIAAIAPKLNPTAVAHWRFDDLLHETVGAYGGNPLVANIIKDMRRLTKMFEQQKLPERVAPGWDEHDELLKALEARDGERASLAMTTHLRLARRSVVDTL